MLIPDVAKLQGMTQQDSRRQSFFFLGEYMFCVFGWKRGVYRRGVVCLRRFGPSYPGMRHFHRYRL